MTDEQREIERLRQSLAEAHAALHGLDRAARRAIHAMGREALVFIVLGFVAGMVTGAALMQIRMLP